MPKLRKMLGDITSPECAVPDEPNPAKINWNC